MRIIQTVFISLLLTSVITVTKISPNKNVCTCDQIQYKPDCQKVYINNTNPLLPPITCRWIQHVNTTKNQPKGVCRQGIIANTLAVPVQVTPTYCFSISITNCASTFGCALPDGKICVPFTGCSAYVMNTNAKCQAISTQCTTDGTQCANKQQCSYYNSDLTNCGYFSSRSGSGKCKLSGTFCIDQICSDAPSSFNTDLLCNSFIQGCVTNGVGCQNAHVSCSTFTGTAETCATFIGLVPEGQCTSTCTEFYGNLEQCSGIVHLTSGKCTQIYKVCQNQSAAYCNILIGSSISTCSNQHNACTWSSGTTCIAVGSCSSYAGLAVNCNALFDQNGLRCGSNTSSQGQCILANWCTDYNTGGQANAISYCKQLQDALGNTCSADFDNDVICNYPAIGNHYAISPGQCLQGQVQSSGKCIEAIQCESFRGPFYNSIQNCQSANPQCTWTSGSQCRATASIIYCYEYKLPGEVPPFNALIGNNYCTQFTGINGRCQYMGQASSQSATTCQEPLRSCTFYTAITIGQPLSGPVCVKFQNSSKGWCGFNSNYGCFEPTTCYNNYGLAQGVAAAQQLCQAIIDISSNAPCQQPNESQQCQSAPSTCNEYFPSEYGSAAIACQGYFIGTQKCGYIQGATTCSNRECSDAGVDVTNCSTYIGSTCGWNGTFCSGTRTCDDVGVTEAQCNTYIGNTCGWNGTICSLVPRACMFYAGATVAVCSALFDRLGRQCWWTNGANCSDIQCSQVGIPAATHAYCQLYNSGCTLASWYKKTCQVIRISCFKYFVTSPYLSDCSLMYDAQNIQCQQPYYDGPCTYSIAPSSTLATSNACLVNPAYIWNADTNTCTGVSSIVFACPAVIAIGATFQAKLAYCQSLTSQLYGTPCYFSQYKAGQLSTNCVDSIISPSIAACTQARGVPFICNSLVDTLGLKCGSNTNSSSACIYANWCTDYNTGGSVTAIAYCATLQDALGNICTAFNNNDAICSYPISGNKFALGYAQCTAVEFIVNGRCVRPKNQVTCSQLTGFYFRSAANCNNFLQSCTWIQGGTSCIHTGECTNYTLTEPPQNAILGNQYCHQYEGISGTCQFIGVAATQPTACAEPLSSCNIYSPTETGETTLTANICALIQNTNSHQCGVFIDGSKCSDPSVCASVIGISQGFSAAALCQGTIDSTTFTPCSQPIQSQTICQPGASTCAGYSPTPNSTIDQSAMLCQGYFTNTGIRCGYTIGSSTCTNRTCGDYGVTQRICSTYIKATCIWSIAGTCVPISTINTCSQYNGASQAVCQALFDNKGRQCNWISGAIACSDMQCSQLTVSSEISSHSSCQLLNFGCTAAPNLLDKKCQTIQTSCFKYRVTTLSDCQEMYDAQGIVCAAPIVAGPCTYSTTLPTEGSVTEANCLINPAFVYTKGVSANANRCTGVSSIVATCIGTIALGSTYQDQLNYCSNLISGIDGKQCFFYKYNSDGSLATNCIAQNQTSSYSPNCQAAGSGSETDCAAFSSGCTSRLSNTITVQTVTHCSTLTCSMASASIAISTSACQNFLSTCIWNGISTCISASTAQCSDLYGTLSQCASFRVNDLPCYQPSQSISVISQCALVTCSNAPYTITSNQGCESWLPSIFWKGSNPYNAIINPGPNLSCVWTGSTGCTTPQRCSYFTGTINICSKIIATDGPCKAGLGLNCTPLLCIDAPNTYTTDAQCQSFANKSLQNCLTTGNGCIAKNALQCTSIINQNSCKNSMLGGVGTNQCSWLPSCVASVSTCNDPSLSNASLCATTPVKGITCMWDGQNCVNATCASFPVTYTTHAACSNALSSCTTTGSGCITMGPCSSYTTGGQSACLNANNQGIIGNPQITQCAWSSGICRPIICTDNNRATSNNQCNINGLTGCITTGMGCISSKSFTCYSFITATACFVDQHNNPCLWINGFCQPYTGCNSIAWTTHKACSSILTSGLGGCTSNGNNCIPLDSGMNYSNPISCVVSNRQDICGWLPANPKGNITASCVIFTSCQDAIGTNNDMCQLYNSSCISNGTNCQTVSKCATYTQQACQINQGTDGPCIWDQTNTKCRIQQCIDAINVPSIDVTQHAACAAFSGPLINSCTTNGTTCINRGQCSQYTNYAGCVIGIDGPCIWTTNSAKIGSCRIQICTDAVFTTNSQCATAIMVVNLNTTQTQISYLPCVTNGSNCIPKSICSSYINYISCQAGGTDGPCAFNLQNTRTQVGTCQLMTECSIANNDPIACNKFPDRCIYVNEVGKHGCAPLTCSMFQSICKPIPSFDYSYYQICAPVSATNSTCVPSDGSVNNENNCFVGANGQYTWNDTSMTCNFCGIEDTTTQSSTTIVNDTQTKQSILIQLVCGLILANI